MREIGRDFEPAFRIHTKTRKTRHGPRNSVFDSGLYNWKEAVWQFP
jgi:hypothetical protein